ncbi:hypothetical protein H6G80_04365 [Nostoc sp. FACHB-87]|nr:hypothetical protein [Nostoc sp. FACHB-87]
MTGINLYFNIKDMIKAIASFPQEQSNRPYLNPTKGKSDRLIPAKKRAIAFIPLTKGAYR